jgi:hypothetical protein
LFSFAVELRLYVQLTCLAIQGSLLEPNQNQY